jgi:hypothetical protein
MHCALWDTVLFTGYAGIICYYFLSKTLSVKVDNYTAFHDLSSEFLHKLIDLTRLAKVMLIEDIPLCY